MNTLPKDLEDIIVDYKNDLESFNELTHHDLITEKLSYEKKLNNELQKDKKNFGELFFFSQQLNKIKDVIIDRSSKSDYCDGCEKHHCYDFVICEFCDKQYCEDLIGDLCNTCDECSVFFCEDCGGNCNECDSIFCKECRTIEDDECNECFEEGCN